MLGYQCRGVLIAQTLLKIVDAKLQSSFMQHNILPLKRFV